MKRYIFEIIIDEGYDEFWEGVNADPGLGVSDLHTMIKECLAHSGLEDSEVRLKLFVDKD